MYSHVSNTCSNSSVCLGVFMFYIYYTYLLSTTTRRSTNQMSHVQLSATPEQMHATRLDTGGASLVLGCDLVVTASTEAVAKMRSEEHTSELQSPCNIV